MFDVQLPSVKSAKDHLGSAGRVVGAGRTSGRTRLRYVSPAESPNGNPTDDFGPNEWMVDEIYHQYLADRNAVDPAWWDFFADYKPSERSPAQVPATTSSVATEPAVAIPVATASDHVSCPRGNKHPPRPQLTQRPRRAKTQLFRRHQARPKKSQFFAGPPPESWRTCRPASKSRPRRVFARFPPSCSSTTELSSTITSGVAAAAGEFHAPAGLRHRQGPANAPRNELCVCRSQWQTGRGPSRFSELRPRHRLAQTRRHSPVVGPEYQRRPAHGLRQVLDVLRRLGSPGSAGTSWCRRLRRNHDQPDQPRNARHSSQRSATHAWPRCNCRRRGSGVSS